MNKELKIAPLFSKILDSDNGIEVFLPSRILIGTTDKDEFRFYDAFSQKIYYSVNDYSGDTVYYNAFNYVKLLKDFMNDYPNLTLIEAINKYLNKLKENVYYIALENGKVEDFC